jgi:choloylglycine hydrolase
MRIPIFILITSSLIACTDFIVTDTEGHVVNGRSLEFGIQLEAEFAFFPQGTSWTSTLGDGTDGISWTSRYATLAITAFKQPFAMDGINEAGLSFGLLWFPEADYPQPDREKPRIASNDIGMWLLGTCATVNDVREALSRVAIEFITFAPLESPV